MKGSPSGLLFMVEMAVTARRNGARGALRCAMALYFMQNALLRKGFDYVRFRLPLGDGYEKSSPSGLLFMVERMFS